MRIARIDQSHITVGEPAILFPGVSFSAAGPNQEFMQENGCMPVVDFLAYDSSTQKLVQVPPYIDGAIVVTVAVVDLDEAEIRAQTVPASVTMASARIILLRAGITDAAVRAQIAAIEDVLTREEALIQWDYEQRVRRDSPLVAMLAAALGLTEGQVDDMFIAAGQRDAAT